MWVRIPPMTPICMKKVIGQKYPAKCLIDHKTGKNVMIEHTANSYAIRRAARQSAKALLKSLNEPTGLAPI